MLVTVTPAPASGQIAAPPSKSYTHRALLAGHFTGRRYRVVSPLVSDDTRATREGLRALGTRAVSRSGVWTLSPEPGRTGLRRSRTIRCGESGTTLRLLSAAAATLDRPIEFVGHRRLSVRPMSGLVDSLTRGGVLVQTPPSRALPMSVSGPMRPGPWTVDGSVSSQFVSALLFALPTLPGPSTLAVSGERVSEPYVQATAAVLDAHRVIVTGRQGRWTIDGPQSFRGDRFVVPGDASSAAYLWAAAAVSGGRVTVTGIPPRWPQADRQILDILRQAGAGVVEEGAGATVVGPLRRPVNVDLTQCPDLYPLVGALAALIPGRSALRGAAHVVFKESDRRAATIALVRALGGRARVVRGGLEVQGTQSPTAVRLKGLTDHRLVMSAAVAALAARRPSTISDAAAVAKSFPGFWHALRTLGPGVSGP